MTPTSIKEGRRNSHVLRLLVTAALALVSAGFPLLALTSMVATTYQFLPDTAGLIVVIGLIVLGLTTAVTTVVVQCLSEGAQRQAQGVMAVIAIIGVAATGLMLLVPSLAWTFPRYLPLVTLLKLDSIDVGAAEDATNLEPWFEIWLALMPLAFAAKWGISRILRHK